MATKVVILGTGGNCVDLLDTMWDVNDARGSAIYEPVGFLDDNAARHGEEICGVPVLGGLALARALEGCQFINGIGSPASFRAKGEIIASCGVPDERFVTLVHPSAQVSRLATLSPGVAIFQNATITSNVWIGAHVIVLPNAVISHDNRIGAYGCVAGAACLSGNVTVGEHVYIGAGRAGAAGGPDRRGRAAWDGRGRGARRRAGHRRRRQPRAPLAPLHLSPGGGSPDAPRGGLASPCMLSTQQ